VAELDRERLRRLTERLDVAAQRAEQLLSETVLAAAAAPPPDDQGPTQTGPNARDDTTLRVVDADADADAGLQRPPPSGWRQPPLDDRSARERWLESDELELLMTVLAGVRDRIPPELRRRLADAVRELLMAFRALIDWYLERTDRPPHGDTGVENIPIL
jgi:hypothetical protein